MNDKDKEYNEFLEIYDKGNGNRPTQRQSAQQTRTTARPGRYLAPKRMSAKKRKAHQRKIAVVSVLALSTSVYKLQIDFEIFFIFFYHRRRFSW